MAVIHDVMPSFDLYQPASVADALNLLDRHGRDAWVLAGGLDSFDWLKDRIKKPKAVVDLSGISELQGIRESGDGLEIWNWPAWCPKTGSRGTPSSSSRSVTS